MTAKEAFPLFLRQLADEFEKKDGDVGAVILQQFDLHGFDVHVVFRPGQQVHLRAERGYPEGEKPSDLAVERWAERM